MTDVTLERSRLRGFVEFCCLGGIGGAVAVVAAMAGAKYAGAGAAAFVFFAVLFAARNRERVVMVTMVAATAAIMHKQFGTPYPTSGGPPSVYVNTVDVMTLLLYGFWWSTGTMGAALRRELRRPVLWLPLIGMVLCLPSILGAQDVTLTVAEFVRMSFLWLLFVYFAVRLRTKADIWWVFGTLGFVAVVELVIVVGQWVTHGPLGLSFLGTPDTLKNLRITDSGSFGRPFGTVEHPVFLAAYLGTIASMAFALALRLEDRRLKTACLVISVVGVAPMAISHTRSAALGMAVMVVVIGVGMLLTRQLKIRVAFGWLLAAAVAAIVAWPELSSLYHSDFATAHFTTEVDARGQLETLAWHIFTQRPFLGVGLNNFVPVMDHYSKISLIFDGNPVHNLLLLQASETGLLGLLGMAVAALPVLVGAFRLLKSPDRLLSGIGIGIIAIFVFFLTEEQLNFSLRQDHPRTVFWLLCGVSVAATRLTERLRATPPASVSGLRVPLPRRPAPRPAGRSGLGQAMLAVARGAVRPLRAVAPLGRGILPGTAVLALAVGQHARRHPSHRGAHGVRSLRRGRRLARRWVRALRVPLAVAVFAGVVGTAATGSAVVDPLRGAVVVFTAADRPGTPDGKPLPGRIFTMNGDASNLREVTPDVQGLSWSWSEWALGGSKIIATARDYAEGPGAPEEIYLMNPDGTGVQALTNNLWQNGQPRVSPDGTKVIFTSSWSEYPKFALYEMDLATLKIKNLSAADYQGGAASADAKWYPDGSRIVFARSTDDHHEVAPTQIFSMRADGTDVRRITDSAYFDTDPEVSPDGRYVAFSAYHPTPDEPLPGDAHNLQAHLESWFVTVRDLRTGAETELTKGGACEKTIPPATCGPGEGAGYIPNFTPDGTAVGYLGILNANTVCICMANPDGSDQRVVYSTSRLIQWFDWIVPSAPAAQPQIATRADPSRLLINGTSDKLGKIPDLATSRADRWGDQLVSPAVSAALLPQGGRWSPDRKYILFTANVPYKSSDARPGPPPPPGETRHRHYTVGLLQQAYFPPFDRVGTDTQQAFVMDADGTNVRQLTKPWTEDWRDAIPDGDWRGNSDPDMSPDDRYVVVVNSATDTQESFLLRIDLETGEVLNLTNATAGAMPVTDFDPRWSPDGKHIVFATATGDSTQIAEIDADGTNYRLLTDDDHLNIQPSWSPDGRSVVYASYRGAAPVRLPDNSGQTAGRRALRTTDWHLVTVDVATGASTVLTSAAESPTFNPVFSPDGSQIAYIGLNPDAHEPDVYVVNADGSDPRPMQVTLLTKETSLDWR